MDPIMSPADPPTYTIPEFCKAHKIGRTYFYEVLVPLGSAPAITLLGTRRVITREAAAHWRSEHTGRSLPSRPKRLEELAGRRQEPGVMTSAAK
jgi:hypothetical protein